MSEPTYTGPGLFTFKKLDTGSPAWIATTCNQCERQVSGPEDTVLAWARSHAERKHPRGRHVATDDRPNTDPLYAHRVPGRDEHWLRLDHYQPKHTSAW